MCRSNNRMSDYFLAAAEHEGPSLFPSGLLMYNLPSVRRTASRAISHDVQVISRQSSSSSSLSRKQSPSPDPSSSASTSPILNDESAKLNLTTSEDWWRQAIEPMPTKVLAASHSAFSMNEIGDGDDDSTNQLFSLLPSFRSNEKVVVHNQLLITLTHIHTNQTGDYVKQCYERRALPNLPTLIKSGLLKIHKERSIRMTISNKKEIFGQLDKMGKILSTTDNRLFDTVEEFYRSYHSNRKRNDNLESIYQSVRWYDRSFHSILLDYAGTILNMSDLKTRLIGDDELLVTDSSIDVLSKEMLCQIDCWNEGRNEIDL